MPLETATYVPDLNVANPAHTDGLSQSDSHARLIKSVLKNTFPNFTATALVSTQAALDNAASAAAGTAVGRFPLGTAALPGLTPVGDPNTGIWSPAADQLALSLNGVQAMLLGGTALVTTLGIAAAAFTTTGAYSGGTGQLVPIGATLLWWDDVLPAEGGYAWANGQIISSANTVCPVLLARWGTRFGGNGVTTMGVPDLRDTVPVGKSTMGGVASRALQSLSNTTLGALLGVANFVLGLANLPSITSTGNNTINVTSPLVVPSAPGGWSVWQNATSSGSNNLPTTGSTLNSSTIAASGVNSISVTSAGTTSTAMSLVQPSTTCNYIIRLA